LDLSLEDIRSAENKSVITTGNTVSLTLPSKYFNGKPGMGISDTVDSTAEAVKRALVFTQ
jgi:hypothetical protein